MKTISNAQVEEVLKKYENKDYFISKRSEDALRRNEYIDANSELTKKGKIFAISQKSLDEQCSILSIKKNECKVRSISDNPELCLLEKKKEEGYEGVWAEGRDVY